MQCAQEPETCVTESGIRKVFPEERMVGLFVETVLQQSTRIVQFSGIILNQSNQKECPDSSLLTLVFIIVISECLLQTDGRESGEMWSCSPGSLPVSQKKHSSCLASPGEKGHFHWQISCWFFSSCCGFVNHCFFTSLLC